MSEQHNLVLLTFTDATGWLPAFDEAQRLPGLRMAAALERGTDGVLAVKDTFTRGAGVATVGSGLLGGLVGLLGGPVGVLLGFAAGAALGNAAEEHLATESGAALIVLSVRVPNGGALLALEMRESSPGPADELAARHGAAVERIDAHTFTEQVRAAERKAEAAQTEGQEAGTPDAEGHKPQEP
ncbi:histidine kinase [Kitasatospora sp. NPDC056446]|uniref:histidine kinase n=1 Tax=Kitasatospora sp. NPDC056446 TaxID=3345819 RepID=UPI0036883102